MNPLSRIFKIRTRTLPLLIAGCGLIGLLLRLLITATGIDDKGLMIPGHFAWICMWLVTAAAAVILVAGILPIRAPATHRASFPRSVPGTAGCILAAAGALVSTVSHFRSGPDAAPGWWTTVLFYLEGSLILLAAVSFLLVAFCRFFGKKPVFLFHVAICVYFALEMLDLYRTWSFDPQLHEYCFQLFACIALTMTAYQLAAFDMGMGSHRKLWAWGLAAVYLCCLSAASGLLFITGGIWAFTNLSNPRRPRQQRVAEAEALTGQ